MVKVGHGKASLTLYPKAKLQQQNQEYQSKDVIGGYEYVYPAASYKQLIKSSVGKSGQPKMQRFH